jgi:hypothetical protein
MKNICNDFKDFINYLKNDPKNVSCTYTNSPFGIIPLQKPILSKEKICEYCEGKDHIAVFLEPSKCADYVWLCINPDCLAFEAKTMPRQYQPTPKTFRALEWPKFCEMSELGDLCLNIRFEDIVQSEGKIEYMKKFLARPQGIILMRGDKGTGKTFSSLGMCEFYTRKSISVIFLTQKQMLKKWVQSITDKELNTFQDKVKNIELLVIDDFGIGEVPPGFMSYFMDLINTRNQWSNRGTVVSTNLSGEDFTKYCGEALSDRFTTGQIFHYESSTSRRHKMVL